MRDENDRLLAGTLPASPEVDTVPVELRQATDAVHTILQSLSLPDRALALTDLANARRLSRLFGQDLRYCREEASWYRWTAQVWAPTSQGEVLHQVEGLVDAILQEADQITEPSLADRWRGWAKTSASTARLKAAVTLFQAAHTFSQELLDDQPWLLCCQNGTIDLHTGRLRPHAREDLLTRMVAADYREDATAPTWERFLAQILEDRELIDFLQQVIGQMLVGKVLAQMIFIAHGQGANGKTVLTETLHALMNSYACRINAKTLLSGRRQQVPNDIARLVRRRFVSLVESEAQVRLAEGRLKQLTGGDQITARFLYREFFEFSPQFTLWFVTNHLPLIEGTDHAIWRRICVIPFQVIIPPEEQDLHLREHLWEERDGILRWAVEGCMAWQHQGHLVVPRQLRAFTDRLRGELDLVGSFLEDQGELDPARCVSKALLYRTFDEWCDQSGVEARSKNWFGHQLNQRGFSSGKRAGRRVWRGLGLRYAVPEEGNEHE